MTSLLQGQIFLIQSCIMIFELYTTSIYCGNPYIVQKVCSMKVKYTARFRRHYKKNTGATFKIILSPQLCLKESIDFTSRYRDSTVLDLTADRYVQKCSHNKTVF